MAFKKTLFLENCLLFVEKAEIIIMASIIIISLVFAFVAAEEIRGYRKNEIEKALLLITIIVVVIEMEMHMEMWKNLEKIRKKKFSDLAENYIYY